MLNIRLVFNRQIANRVLKRKNLITRIRPLRLKRNIIANADKDDALTLLRYIVLLNIK